MYNQFFQIIIDWVNGDFQSRLKYNKFCYERLSSHMRGLPKVDQFKELIGKNDSFYEEIKHESSQQSLHRLLDNLEVGK